MGLKLDQLGGLARAVSWVLATGGSLKITVVSGLIAVRRIAPDTAQAMDFRYMIGCVRSSDGTPLVGVKLTLDGRSGSVRSDESGRFSFSNLKAGRYLVSLRHRGYVPKSTTIDLALRPSATQDIVMTPREKPGTRDRKNGSSNKQPARTDAAGPRFRAATEVVIDP